MTCTGIDGHSHSAARISSSYPPRRPRLESSPIPWPLLAGAPAPVEDTEPPLAGAASIPLFNTDDLAGDETAKASEYKHVEKLSIDALKSLGGNGEKADNNKSPSQRRPKPDTDVVAEEDQLTPSKSVSSFAMNYKNPSPYKEDSFALVSPRKRKEFGTILAPPVSSSTHALQNSTTFTLTPPHSPNKTQTGSSPTRPHKSREGTPSRHSRDSTPHVSPYRPGTFELKRVVGDESCGNDTEIEFSKLYKSFDSDSEDDAEMMSVMMESTLHLPTKDEGGSPLRSTTNNSRSKQTERKPAVAVVVQKSHVQRTLFTDPRKDSWIGTPATREARATRLGALDSGTRHVNVGYENTLSQKSANYPWRSSQNGQVVAEKGIPGNTSVTLHARDKGDEAEQIPDILTNNGIDKDGNFFYFDAMKSVDDLPNSSEHLVEWKTCVTVTGKTNFQRVFPDEKAGVKVVVNGETLALFRFDEKVYALSTVCPHRKGPIHMGDIEDIKEHGPCVVCPWHKWTFKLESGKLVKPDNRAGDLTVYPVKLKGARRQVYVGFPEFSNKMFDGDLEDF